jgi:hypothetical protein
MIISGYLARGNQLDQAIGDLSPAYADPAERYNAELGVAVPKGKIAADREG